MNKRIVNIYQHVDVGDYIQNDITGQRWISETCPDCNGTGLFDGRVVVAQCPRCQGTKFIWKTAMFLSLTPAKPDVESD